MEQVTKERDHLQSTLLKQGDNLEEAMKRHMNLKAKYDELRANSARTEAKLLYEVSSLHTQVSDQRNANSELLAEIKGLQEENDTRGRWIGRWPPRCRNLSRSARSSSLWP